MSCTRRSFCLCFELNKCITSPKIWVEINALFIAIDSDKHRNIEGFTSSTLKMGKTGKMRGVNKRVGPLRRARSSHLQHISNIPCINRNHSSPDTKCRPQLPALYRQLRVLFSSPSMRSAPFSTRVSPSPSNMPRPRTNLDYRALPSPQINSKQRSGTHIARRCDNIQITVARMFSEANMEGQGSGGRR